MFDDLNWVLMILGNVIQVFWLGGQEDENMKIGVCPIARNDFDLLINQ